MRLTKGSSSDPTRGACWMQALDIYTSDLALGSDPPSDSADQAEVDDCIRALCITLNDAAPDGEREEIIGPIFWEPLGTRTNDPHVEAARHRLFVATKAKYDQASRLGMRCSCPHCSSANLVGPTVPPEVFLDVMRRARVAIRDAIKAMCDLGRETRKEVVPVRTKKEVYEHCR